MLHQVRLVSEGSRLNQNIYGAVRFLVSCNTCVQFSVGVCQNPLTTESILGKYFAAERF